jgi:hypothetical protein
MMVRGMRAVNHVPSVMLDRLELGYLSGLQDQRAVTARMNAQQAMGMRHLMGRANGVMPGAAPDPQTAELDDDAAGSIINRSPVVNNHYYTQAPAPPGAPVIIEQPQPAPQPGAVGRRASWLWLLLVPLLLGLGALAWYLWPKPSPTPANPYPGYTAEPTIKFSSPPP